MSVLPNLATGVLMTLFHIIFDHASCTCDEFIQIIDEATANDDLHLIWVILLGAVVDDNSCLCDGTIFWNAPDFSIN